MPDDDAAAIGAFVRHALDRDADSNPVERVFYAVRDLPYATDAAHDGFGLIRLGRGDCVAKSDLLSRSLRFLGFKTRIVRWLYNLPPFPPEVELLPTRLDIHTAVQVCTDDGWILADATHDPALAPAGLIVATWDGRCATAAAYQPVGPIWMEGDVEISRALSKIQHAYVGRSQDAAVYRRAFNRWLDEFRAKKL